MAEQFYTILTNIGKAKIANSLPTGQKLNLVKMKIGDSNGKYYNPSENQTDLVHKIYECNVTSVEVDENNPQWITITSAIPSDVGGFSIREVGVFDDTNSLIAIGKYPETYKPVASDGSTKELYIKMTLEVTNAASVEFKIDPTVILATKKDINTLDKKIENNTTQLNDIEKYNRKFKPSLGVPPFWGANAEHPQLATREKILADLKTIKEYGIDEISIIVHIDDNRGTTELCSSENIDDMEYAYEQAIALGLNVSIIKFHQWFFNDSFISNYNTYYTQYKNLIETWSSRFKNKNIPYFTVLNEVNYIYGDSKYEQFTLDCLDIPRKYGFKTSISTQGTNEILNLSDNIKNNVDAFFINCYPMVSYKLENTTIYDALHAWDIPLLNIKSIKETYPNKPIIISETGCQDYYESLCAPGDSTWEKKGLTLTNGKAPYIFLKGLFLSDLQNYVERVHYWFGEALYYDEIKELIYEYTNGGN